jgi:ADP-glucose pyrophosphorylase
MKFMEKPSGGDLSSLRREDAAAAPDNEFLANMGIYVFKREALFRCVLAAALRAWAKWCCVVGLK